MQRRLVRSASTYVVASIACAGPAAAAPETLVMPFSCGRIGSHVTVHASAPKRYALASPRHSIDLPGCQAGRRGLHATDCQRLPVHQFDIQCDGKRTAWSDVALAIAEFHAESAGPLMRLRDAGRDRTAAGGGRASACTLAPRNNRQVASGTSLSLYCTRERDGFPFVRINIPTGYAPLLDTGAKLEATVVARAAGGQAAGKVAGVVPEAVSTSPLPDITPASTGGQTTLSKLGSDVTAAVADPQSEAAMALGAGRSPGGSAGSLAWVFGLLAAVTAGGALAARRYPDRARQLKASGARALLRAILKGELAAMKLTALARTLPLQVARRVKPAGDLKAANAATAAGAMLGDAQARLAEIKSAGPLNDVLATEIAHLKQRLATLEATAAEGEAAAARAAPAFRNLMRDIERVRRIADGAVLSLGGSRNLSRVPATKAEAYDLLGLNPDAPDNTIKKVADGLRMSWHPDLARDDADRQQREARIKAINIAIDLINGKRAAA